jgi:hypothetical protein
MKIKTTKKNPYSRPGTVHDIPQAKAQILIDKGFAVQVGSETTKFETVTKSVTPETDPVKDVWSMNKKQLIDYAGDIGVDISDCSNNAERKAAISNHLQGG